MSKEETGEEKKEQNGEVTQIYDKIFKKVLTLSSKAVINLINGLYDTNYSDDSKITYNWTEFEDDKLKKILADTILTINDRTSYHMEAQMTQDETIVFRVFEYGYRHAERTKTMEKNIYEMTFPEPKIIFLYSEVNIPDTYHLKIHFPNSQFFDYEVSTFQFLKHSATELSDKRMIILIPFLLLKMRRLIEKDRCIQNQELLKSLILDDIMKSIRDNRRVGNITDRDAYILHSLTRQLYKHVYSHYQELEVLSDMTDQSITLEVEELLDQIEEAKSKLHEVNNEVQEKEEKLQEKEEKLQEKEEKLQEKEEKLREKDEIILEMQKEIEELKKKK